MDLTMTPFVLQVPEVMSPGTASGYGPLGLPQMEFSDYLLLG